MTERYSALTVVLDTNMREDDARSLIAAIQQLRGVLTVTGHPVETAAFVAEQRVRQEIGRKLMDVIFPKEGTT